jgi:hypothetical protein
VGEDETGQSLRLVVVDRHGGFGAAALVPDAEANVPLRLAPAEVTRDAERAPAVALDRRVGPEELDELVALRRGAPGAVVEPRLDRPAALSAIAHRVSKGLAPRVWHP